MIWKCGSIVVLLLQALLCLPPLASAGHDYSQALSKSNLFYKAQRADSGKASGIDLVGGYYDAGDEVKFCLPMAFAFTMMSWSIIEYNRQMAATSELDHAMEIVKWGIDYFIKVHPISPSRKNGRFDWQCHTSANERTKKWKYSRNIVSCQRNCENHVHHGRNRSRKPVEIPTPLNAPSSSKQNSFSTLNHLPTMAKLNLQRCLLKYQQRKKDDSCSIDAPRAAANQQQRKPPSTSPEVSCVEIGPAPTATTPSLPSDKFERQVTMPNKAVIGSNQQATLISNVSFLATDKC
ncbi:Endoglucanase [Asimina triloba]